MDAILLPEIKYVNKKVGKSIVDCYIHISVTPLKVVKQRPCEISSDIDGIQSYSFRYEKLERWFLYLPYFFTFEKLV